MVSVNSVRWRVRSFGDVLQATRPDGRRATITYDTTGRWTAHVEREPGKLAGLNADMVRVGAGTQLQAKRLALGWVAP